jgi:hypothetical protein
MIDFASNFNIFAFTKLFAFMKNHDFESRINFNLFDSKTFLDRLTIRKRTFSLTVESGFGQKFKFNPRIDVRSN